MEGAELLKARNSEGGLNMQFLGNMALVSLYQYWEDYHRGQIAIELGISKNQLQAPIFGDLRLLRHSIPHHEGTALKKVERCQLVRWYEEDDEIFIDQAKFKELLVHVRDMLNLLRQAQRSGRLRRDIFCKKNYISQWISPLC